MHPTHTAPVLVFMHVVDFLCMIGRDLATDLQRHASLADEMPIRTQRIQHTYFLIQGVDSLCTTVRDLATDLVRHASLALGARVLQPGRRDSGRERSLLTTY